jgi:hypothetical protein
MKEVSQEDIRVIEVLMRLQPELFWPIHVGYYYTWCGKPYGESEFPKCSRPPGHKGPHVAGISRSNGDIVTFFQDTKPWYD